MESPDVITAAQKEGADIVNQTPLALLHCPSRRAVRLYIATPQKWMNRNSHPVTGGGAMTDYAINTGHTGFPAYFAGPAASIDLARDDDYTGWHQGMSRLTGISFERSEVKRAHIRDGTSNTYLLGEKYLTPDGYSGNVHGDVETWGTGFNDDMHRTAQVPPLRDRAGYATGIPFGSAHIHGLNMAMCDGSVRAIGYNIDSKTHQHLANRQDGQTVDASGL